MSETVFGNISSSSNRYLFNDGTVNSGVAEYSPYYDYIGGGTENFGWHITQWRVTSWFNPQSGVKDDSTAASSLLGGNPDVTFREGDVTDRLGGETLSIFTTNAKTKFASGSVYGADTDAPGGNIYQLNVDGGKETDLNVETSQPQNGKSPTLNHKLTFTAYEDIEASTGNTGVAYTGNNFTVNFNTPNMAFGVFLQVAFYDTRGATYAQAIYNTTNGVNSAGKIYDIGDNQGSFQIDTLNNIGQGLHKVTIDINAAVDTLIAQLVKVSPAYASSLEDLSNWTLGGSYIGVENGEGDDTNAVSNRSLTLDVSNADITVDDSQTVAYNATPQKVQTIDDNTTETGVTNLTTIAGQSANISLTGNSIFSGQTIVSNGTDTITTAPGADSKITGNGATLTVIGNTATDLSVTSQASAEIVASDNTALTATGVFRNATVTTNNTASKINISAQNATLNIMAGEASITMTKTGTLSLTSGSKAQFIVDTQKNGDNSTDTTVLTNQDNTTIHNTGGGKQIIVSGNTDENTKNNVVTVSGGGEQQIWTGSQNYSFTASSQENTGLDNIFSTTNFTGDRAYIGIQDGTNSVVNLNGETTTVWTSGGNVTVNGSTDANSKDLVVNQGDGHNTINGGAEQLYYVSFDHDNHTNPDVITAGSGTQTLFLGKLSVTINGGEDSRGSQVIVGSKGEDTTHQSMIINGGAATQNIYTQDSDFTINASTTDASGKMTVDQQGGTNIFNSGQENVAYYAQGGDTTMNLAAGAGKVTIQGDASLFGHLNLYGYTDTNDSLIVTGLKSKTDFSLSYNNNDIQIVMGSGATITTYNEHLVFAGNIGDNAAQFKLG